MRMKQLGLKWRAALLVGACLLAGNFTARVAADAGTPAPQNSRAVAKPLKAAQDAMNAKKYSEALARIREVQATPGRNAYDEYAANEMLAFVSARTKDYPEAARAYEQSLTSPYLDQAEVPKRVQLLVQLNYQLKNYDKVIEFANRAIRGGYADDDLQTLLGQAYYLRGDYKNTQRIFDSLVDAQIKRGQAPKEQPLQLILSACSKLESTDCVTRTLERLVAYYPKTEYWQNLMYSLFQVRGQNDDKVLLQVYRLASEVDALKRPDDYTEMAQLALDQGSPGEAQRVLEKGFEKKIFPDARTQDKNRRLLASAKRKAASDLATLDIVAKDAAATATGDKDVSVGLAYLSYQQYDKAIEALRRGLGKPGVHSEPEARLLLGIAQLEAGSRDDAVKTFRSVKGDKKLERLANLWGLHARQA